MNSQAHLQKQLIIKRTILCVGYSDTMNQEQNT